MSPMHRSSRSIGTGHVGTTAAWVMVVALGAAACSSPDPGATKLEDDPKRTRLGQPQKPPRPANPALKSAELDAPTSTEGPALAAEKIDAILASYHAEKDKLADVQAAAILRPCANREPASARCDGELGLLLLPIERRRASALYYTTRAASVDDPAASAELYARLAEALRPHGKYAEAAQAYAHAIAREDKAEYHARRSAMLQSMPGDNATKVGFAREAADELATARSMEPNWAWMRDEAVLRARIPDQWEQAKSLLEQVSATAPDDRSKKLFAGRAEQVQQLIEARDAAAEQNQK